MIRGVAVLPLLCAFLPRTARAEPLLVPAASEPRAVASLGAIEGPQAFGVSADLATAVLAVPAPDDPRRSSLRVGRAEGTPISLLLPGRAFALAVAPGGDRAYVAVREVGRRFEVRDVRLLAVDLATLRIEAAAPLPVTAAGIALRNGDDGILVASRDDVRTFLLPELTSGPLYRILGANRAVAPVARSTRLFVAQAGRVVLVDLAAPQGRDGLPLGDGVDVSGTPAALASSPDAPEAVLLEEGGAVVGLSADPLRVFPRGQAVAIAWPGHRASPDARIVARTPPPAVAPEAPPPRPAPPAPSASVPERAAPPPDVPEAPLPAPEGPPRGRTIGGTIAGPARDAVAAVVAYGPDNVLREAARVRPDAGGRWSLGELATGTYRIVAVGEGGRVLLCAPPFLTVKVGPDSEAAAPVLNVIGAAP